MPKFRLKHGNHVEGRKLFRAGTPNNIVETDRNLIAIYGKEKFALVGSHQQLANARGPIEEELGHATEGDGGGNPNVNRETRPVASKAEVLQRAKDAEAEAESITGKETEGNKARREALQNKAKAARAAAGEGGEDVTADFPEAVDNDFVVTKQEDGRFNVARADAPDGKLNEAPLTKKGLDSFLKEQAAGDGDEEDTDEEEGRQHTMAAPKKKTAKKKAAK